MSNAETRNDAQIVARTPQWMADGLDTLAKKSRVPMAVVVRWAVEDWLTREGITPDAEQPAA